MKSYYVYTHTRTDTNETFYVGIGTKRNSKYPYITYFRAYHKKGRNKFWDNITSKTGYKIDIILESYDLEEIKQKEKNLISMYGKRINGLGTLVNITDGGESASGMIHSKETRNKMSLARKGKTLNINTEEQEKIVKMFLDGMSVTLIERTLHHRIETINRILKNKSIPRRNHKIKVTEYLVKQVKKNIKDGVSKREIIEKYKISSHIYADIRSGRTWKHVKV